MIGEYSRVGSATPVRLRQSKRSQSTPTSTRWSAELAQRWPFGLGALFFGVMIPIGAGFPDPAHRFGAYRSEVTIVIVLIAGFASVLLALAAITGRRRREFVLATVVLCLLLVHPALMMFFEAQRAAVDAVRVVLGSAAVLVVAMITVGRARIGRLGRLLAGGLAVVAAVLSLVRIQTGADWIELSATLALSCAAVAAGSIALFVGQRETDGAVLSVGLLTLSIGFGGALALMSGGSELTVGLATVAVVSVVLAVAAAFVSVFEAFDRREAASRALGFARSLELSRLSDQSARFEEVAHDQRGALLAIEAAARRLGSRPSGRLASAVAIEAARLSRMLDRAEDDSTMFEVSDAVAPMLEFLRPLYGEVELRNDPSTVAWGHQDDVAEIIRTLVANAHEHGRPPISVAIDGRGETRVVAVSDAGAGVAPALRDSIFERGVTSAPRRHSGLGLYTARRLARERGGDLRVCSYRTATFELVLPVSASSARGSSDPGASDYATGNDARLAYRQLSIFASEPLAPSGALEPTALSTVHEFPVAADG